MRRNTPTGRAPGAGSSCAGSAASLRSTRPSRGDSASRPRSPRSIKKVLEASLADQAKGGQGNFVDHAVRCLPAGMPLMMIAFRPLEFVVTPETTYILIGGSDHYRRIFTDGRDWPTDIEPTYCGLLDRQMDRHRRRRPLRPARGRDARSLQGSARLRRHRPAAALRQSVHRSRSGSTSTRPIRISCTTRSP